MVTQPAPHRHAMTGGLTFCSPWPAVQRSAIVSGLVAGVAGWRAIHIAAAVAAIAFVQSPGVSHRPTRTRRAGRSYRRPALRPSARPWTVTSGHGRILGCCPHMLHRRGTYGSLRRGHHRRGRRHRHRPPGGRHPQPAAGLRRLARSPQQDQHGCVTSNFLGGAIGSAVATILWSVGGWTAPETRAPRRRRGLDPTTGSVGR